MADNHQNEGVGLIYQHHYDRDLEADLEKNIMNLIMWMQEWSARNTHLYTDPATNSQEKYTTPIKDSSAIAEIRKAYSLARFLCMKYQEWDAVNSINSYIEFLTEQRELDALSTLKNLEVLSEIISKNLGIKHRFRDRVEDKQPWDLKFKKKLGFKREIEQKHLDFFNTIDREWKKLAFLLTYYVVAKEGDAHILLSGPNLSGKSNTAMCLLRQCSVYLVDYWKVGMFNDHYIEKHEEARGIPQRKFEIKEDSYITPDPTMLKTRFASQQYQCIDINEGMEAATNLQSMKSDIVSLGVKRFTSRSSHNIVVWEYQVQQRPTAMMLEGMNFWVQKMYPEHFVLSIASMLVRKKDPYYMKELDKCRTDKEIGTWMTKINPNYIHTFRAPRLSKRKEKEFKIHYEEQKALQLVSDNVRTKVGHEYNLMLNKVYEMEAKHEIDFIEIESRILDPIGYNLKDKQAFMRDYGRLKRAKMYEKWAATVEQEVAKQ